MVFISSGADLRNPKEFDSAIEAGASNLYLHNVNTEQKVFIEDFGNKVLPQFHSSWPEE
jgi:hypothetical protein